MKYLVFSDVHGSSYYMKKVLDLFNESKCDKLICLGDLLYHGPRNDLPFGHNPKEVVTLINEYKDKIIMVKGNCEAEVDQMVLDFFIHDIYTIEESRNIVLTHGHHINPENPSNYIYGTICLYGHTHVPKVTDVSGVYFVNPGSTSIPKEASHHSCIIMDVNEDVTMSFIDLETFEEYNNIKL